MKPVFRVYVRLTQGRLVIIPSQIRKAMKLKENEYLLLTSDLRKIELIPTGTTVIPEVWGSID